MKCEQSGRASACPLSPPGLSGSLRRIDIRGEGWGEGLHKEMSGTGDRNRRLPCQSAVMIRTCCVSLSVTLAKVQYLSEPLIGVTFT
jgi:hypothetical protein